jgi:phage recombination protein Bet
MATTESALMKAGAQQSLIKIMAEKYGVEPGKFYNSIVSTVFPAGKAKPGAEPVPGRGLPPSEAMVMTFLVVCNQYDLNPFLREIYPFIDSEGNLKIIVGVDGWIKTALRQKDYAGHEFQDHIDADGNLFAVTCSMYRVDRERPVKMVEYMKECKMATTPWEKWPYRMLHHKAFIQAARYAFGMGNLTDEDELDRIQGSHSNTTLEEPRRLSEAGSPVAPSNGGNGSTTTVTAGPVSTEPAASVVTKAKIPTDPIPGGETVKDGPASEADVKRVWEVAFPKGLSKVDVNGMVKKQFSVDRVQNLTRSQIEKLIGDLQAL